MAASLASTAAARWHHRLLIVFAGRPDDRLLAAQRELAADPGFGERDLRLITVAGPQVTGVAEDAAALRRRYAVPAQGFHALLVGKDGHVAERRERPFSSAELFGAIDAMPMRQDEMKRR